jgi:calcineurin-like phosphoesterase family protein
MICFSADQHFHHSKIIGYVSRRIAGWGRLFEDADEMNSVMIERWNEVVSKSDTIYVLGDFCLARGTQVLELFWQLTGSIKIVPGGHDMRWLKDLGFKPGDTGHLYEQFGVSVEILPQLYHLKMPKNWGGPKIIVLSHYPMFTWEQSHHGSWHLHGHSHGGLGKGNRYQKMISSPPSTLEDGRSMDVGVDAWDFYPVSIDEVKKRLKHEPK